MPEQPPYSLGQRWFHTIVVVGTSLTAGGGCLGSRPDSSDGAYQPDVGSQTDRTSTPDGTHDSGFDGLTAEAGMDAGQDGAPVGADAAGDLPVIHIDAGLPPDGPFDYPHIVP